MGNKSEIIASLAKERMVEKMIENISHQTLSSDLQDLAQMVYLILLEYDEDKILELDRLGQMRFFVARIIINQFRSSNSPFHTIYRKFKDKSVNLENLDFEDETGE